MVIIVHFFSSLHNFVMFKDICKWDLLPLIWDGPLNFRFRAMWGCIEGVQPPLSTGSGWKSVTNVNGVICHFHFHNLTAQHCKNDSLAWRRILQVLGLIVVKMTHLTHLGIMVQVCTLNCHNGCTVGEQTYTFTDRGARMNPWYSWLVCSHTSTSAPWEVQICTLRGAKIHV